jgi:hypothetical protein
MYHEIKHWVGEYSAQHSFDNDRVMFVSPFSNHQERSAMLRHTDLFLNSSGGCDALTLMKPVLSIKREDSDFLSLLACDMMLAVGLELFVVNNNQDFLLKGEEFAKSQPAPKRVQQHLENHNTEHSDKWIRAFEEAIQSGVRQMNASGGDRSKLDHIDVSDSLKMQVFLDEDEIMRNRVLDRISENKDLCPKFKLVLLMFMQELQCAGIQILKFAGVGGRAITL